MLPLSNSTIKPVVPYQLEDTTLRGSEPHSVEMGMEINDHCYSSDGCLLALAAKNGEIGLYEIETETFKFAGVLKGHSTEVFSVTFSPDSKILASASEDAELKLWSVHSGEALHTLEASDCVWSMSFSPDSSLLASGNDDGTVQLWSVEDGEMLYTLEGHDAAVFSVNFSPGGEVLTSIDNNERMKSWNLGNYIQGISTKNSRSPERLAEHEFLPLTERNLINMTNREAERLSQVGYDEEDLGLMLA